MSPAHAAPYACSGLTTYSAIRKLDPYTLSEERVVVVGAGGLGLMCVSLLQAMGCPGVVVVEIDAGRRQAATDMGAVAVIDPTESNAAELEAGQVTGRVILQPDANF